MTEASIKENNLFKSPAKKLKLLTTKTNRDAFATPASPWRTCRDQFSHDFVPNTKTIYYMFNPANAAFPHCDDVDQGCKNIARFFRDTEERLKWKKTHFYKTNYPNILYVNIRSNRWLKGSSLFRSLFTLFLRAGVNYSPNISYDEALQANTYSRGSVNAINKFLDGYTVISKSYKTKDKWYDAFNGKSLDRLKKLLYANKNLIRKQAIIEWEKAGKPEGQDEEIWEKAKKALRS